MADHFIGTNVPRQESPLVTPHRYLRPCRAALAGRTMLRGFSTHPWTGDRWWRDRRHSSSKAPQHLVLALIGDLSRLQSAGHSRSAARELTREFRAHAFNQARSSTTAGGACVNDANNRSSSTLGAILR